MSRASRLLEVQQVSEIRSVAGPTPSPARSMPATPSHGPVAEKVKVLTVARTRSTPPRPKAAQPRSSKIASKGDGLSKFIARSCRAERPEADPARRVISGRRGCRTARTSRGKRSRQDRRGGARPYGASRAAVSTPASCQRLSRSARPARSSTPTLYCRRHLRCDPALGQA